MEEEIQLEVRDGESPVVEGALMYGDGTLKIQDARGMYNPRQAALDEVMISSVTGGIYVSSIDGQVYRL